MWDLRENLKRIIHPNGEDIRLGPKGLRNIELKRQVAALMLADLDSVHPDFGKIIHRAKAKDHSPVRDEPLRRDRKLALIPGFPRVITEALIRLPGRRDNDLRTVIDIQGL